MQSPLPRRRPPCVEVIDPRTAEVYRRMAPEERATKCLEMFQFARAIAESAVRDRYPDASDAEIARLVHQRMSRAPD